MKRKFRHVAGRMLRSVSLKSFKLHPFHSPSRAALRAPLPTAALFIPFIISRAISRHFGTLIPAAAPGSRAGGAQEKGSFRFGRRLLRCKNFSHFDSSARECEMYRDVCPTEPRMGQTRDARGTPAGVMIATHFRTYVISLAVTIK